jgi:pyruvate/2-oxoglutarate dehydrogenase complex dihydrolipoamide dehydrogenase (E3) component
MRRMRELRARIAPADSFSGARALGVDVFQGEAVFVGPDSVRVGGQTLRFRRCVIATGARARLPELPGLDRVAYHTNATIFNLEELPRRLLVLGGGPISMELGQAFATLGSEVRVLLRGERPLSGEDPEVAALVRASLEEDGVAFSCGLRFESVEPLGSGCGGCRVRARDAGGAPVEFEGDCLLVSTGRQPNVQGLGLEAAGVAFSAEHGVGVDDELWTSNRSVLAVGDCVAQEYRYTHLSGTQAQMAVENALFGGHRRVSDLVLPHVTYTEPEVATVGLTEARAREAGVPVELYSVSLEHNDRAILDSATRGLARVLCRQGSDEIVGATIVADHAGEMISEIALAIQFGIGLGPVRGIGALIHSYPTVAECVAGAAFQFKMKHWAKRHADGVVRATQYRLHHAGVVPSDGGQGLLGRASQAQFSGLHLAAACAATAAIVGVLCARL